MSCPKDTEVATVFSLEPGVEGWYSPQLGPLSLVGALSLDPADAESGQAVLRNTALMPSTPTPPSGRKALHSSGARVSLKINSAPWSLSYLSPCGGEDRMGTHILSCPRGLLLSTQPLFLLPISATNSWGTSEISAVLGISRYQGRTSGRWTELSSPGSGRMTQGHVSPSEGPRLVT